MVGRPLISAAPKSLKLYLGAFVRSLAEFGYSLALSEARNYLSGDQFDRAHYLCRAVLCLGARIRSKRGGAVINTYFEMVLARARLTKVQNRFTLDLRPCSD